MALLDDAIREHLELKRRRGADPADIERLEREALGPVRRAPEEPVLPPEAPVVAFDQELEDPGYVAPQPEHHGVQERPPSSSKPGEEPMAADRSADSAATRQAQRRDVETEEYDVEGEDVDKKPREDKAAGGDMLEETPEFLQDAPDHDRLWFEQRPPRDFDFGG